MVIRKESYELNDEQALLIDEDAFIARIMDNDSQKALKPRRKKRYHHPSWSLVYFGVKPKMAVEQPIICTPRFNTMRNGEAESAVINESKILNVDQNISKS